MVHIRWLLYADDLVMFCKSIVEVKTIMNIPNDTCSRFGLSITISFSKAKTQVFNNDELANLASLFSIGENVVENVSEFTYPGQTFSNKDQGSRTDLRVSKEIGKFNEMRQVLTENYRVFSHDVTQAILVSQNNETVTMLVSQTNPLGVELFSYANAFFCFNKFA